MYYVELDTDTDTFGTPATLAARITTPTALGATCHASAILANGDYLAMIRYTNAADVTEQNDQYRSTDGGATWVNEGSPIDGSDVALPTVHGAASMFVTSTGAIISDWWDYNTSSDLQFWRSTDSGAHWTKLTKLTTPLPGKPLEVAFFEHPTTNRIAAVVRTGTTGSHSEPLFTYSDDDGVTWAPLVRLGQWYNQYHNPAAIIYHADDDVVEMFMGSRTTQDDGNGSIFRVTATADNAARNVWSTQDRIFTGDDSRDFGYPAAIKVGSKVYLCWYDNGGAGNPDIYMAVGTRP